MTDLQGIHSEMMTYQMIPTSARYCIHRWKLIGKLKPKLMITKKTAFDRVVENGFTALMEDQDRQVNIFVEVNPGGI